jgi:hypothetical protein
MYWQEHEKAIGSVQLYTPYIYTHTYIKRVTLSLKANHETTGNMKTKISASHA